ncbi:hypothetical protein RYX36_027019 [Vicia faba]
MTKQAHATRSIRLRVARFNGWARDVVDELLNIVGEPFVDDVYTVAEEVDGQGLNDSLYGTSKT